MSLDKKRKQNLKAYEQLTRAQEKRLIVTYKSSLDTLRAEIAYGFEKWGSDFKDWQKYNRLSNLEKSIMIEIAKLSRKTAPDIRRAAEGTFKESYYRTGWMLETDVGAKLGFGILDSQVIAKAVINPLDNIGFLERNKASSTRLARQLREHLAQGLIQGKGYSEVARTIKNRMDIGAMEALRIARTEMHRTWEQGHKDGIAQAQDMGLDIELIWDATLDSRTRKTHQAMDGQVADEDGMFELRGIKVEGPGMTGIPEEDIHCRCTIREQIKGYGPQVRMARQIEGKAGELIKYQTYPEWAKARV